MQKNKELISHDVLADDMVFDAMDGYTAQWNVNGETVSFGVKVAG